MNDEIPDKELTLDDWVERHALSLAEDIGVHLSVWEVEDPNELRRMIMTSIRNRWPVIYTGRGKPLPIEASED